MDDIIIVQRNIWIKGMIYMNANSTTHTVFTQSVLPILQLSLALYFATHPIYDAYYIASETYNEPIKVIIDMLLLFIKNITFPESRQMSRRCLTYESILRTIKRWNAQSEGGRISRDK